MRARWPLFLPGFVGLGVLAWLVRPWSVGPVGFDAAASVIHFDRIATGARLEAFVTATPKPLLTVVYGVLYAIVSDWRAISIAALIACGVGIGFAALAVRRALPGKDAGLAALAVPVLIVGSPSLVADVAIAYAVSWALAGCAIAAVAALEERPRAGIVGLGILVATLARLETVVVVAAIGFAVIVRTARRLPWRSSAGWDSRRLAIAAFVGALALPVMLVHDLLLTGNPMFWASVSAVFSAETASIPTPLAVARHAAGVVLSRPIPSVIAMLGLLALARGRGRPLLVGILAAAPGLAALLILLAVRGTYVSTRYYAGIELALAIATAAGVVAVAGWAGRRVSHGRGALAGSAPTLAGGAVLAIAVLSGPFAPTSGATRSTLASQRALAAVADVSRTAVDDALSGRDVWGEGAEAGGRRTVLYAPILLRPRMAVDHDLPLWAVAGLSQADLSDARARLGPGDVVVHAARFDQPRPAFTTLESGGTVEVAGRRLVTVARPSGTVWVLRVVGS